MSLRNQAEQILPHYIDIRMSIRRFIFNNIQFLIHEILTDANKDIVLEVKKAAGRIFLEDTLYKGVHRPDFTYVLEYDFFVECKHLALEERMKTEKRPHIVASLTSFPARMAFVPHTIKTILDQTLKADIVVLYLGREQFPGLEEDLPSDLLDLESKGLTIRWCEDIRSYKKLIPALIEFPDSMIVTFDDDMLYDLNTIENLYYGYLEYPDCIQAARITWVNYLSDCDIQTITASKEVYTGPTYLHKLVGCSGCLYKPHILHPDIMNVDFFMSHVATNDDIWFWLMGALNGARVNLVDGYPIQFNYVPHSQEGECLWKINEQGEKQVYIQIAATLNHYPQLKELLKQEQMKMDSYPARSRNAQIGKAIRAIESRDMIIDKSASAYFEIEKAMGYFPKHEKSEQAIPVIFCGGDNQVPYICTAIQSIIDHCDTNRHYDVYIFYNILHPKNMDMLKLLSTNNVSVNVYGECARIYSQCGLSVPYSRTENRVALYPFFAQYLFSENGNNVICLDSDVVVQCDIASLSCMPLENCSFAITEQPGLTVINVQNARQNNFASNFFALLEKNDIEDTQRLSHKILLRMCEDYGMMLDTKWCHNALSDSKEVAEKAFIIHYPGDHKPLYALDYPQSEIFWHYAKNSLVYDDVHLYNEKIQWLKLFDSTPDKMKLSDKYRVREWVEETIGGEYLIPIVGAWDKPEDIDFDALPERFVLKGNHGCGYNLIVTNKATLDKEAAIVEMNRWLNEDFAYVYGFELQYHYIKRKIIAEVYLENDAEDLYDYKIWCFDGKPYFIMLLSDRQKGLKMSFYDLDWNILPYSYSYSRNSVPVPKPDNLEEMVTLATKLAKGFSHVRVDLYRMNDGQLYFGEMTFSSAGGTCKWIPESCNDLFGELLTLPEKTALPAFDPCAITVIVPISNNTQTLEACLDSIVTQTMRDIEIICIDCNSTDDSMSLLRQYAINDVRLIVQQTQDRDSTQAIKAALNRARGQYVTIVQPTGGYASSTALDDMLSTIKTHKAAMCMGDNATLDASSSLFDIAYLRGVIEDQAVVTSAAVSLVSTTILNEEKIVTIPQTIWLNSRPSLIMCKPPRWCRIEATQWR